MNKMVINHLEKLFVTSDASTITSELEVQHPAAKLLVMAAQAQQQEIGDGTNMVRARRLTAGWECGQAATAAASGAAACMLTMSPPRRRNAECCWLPLPSSMLV